MAIETCGAEWNRYFNDNGAWPEGAYLEDEQVFVDGVALGPDDELDGLPEAAQVRVVGGDYYEIRDGKGVFVCPLEEHFQRWKQTEGTIPFIAFIPPDKLEAVQAAVRAILAS